MTFWLWVNIAENAIVLPCLYSIYRNGKKTKQLRESTDKKLEETNDIIGEITPKIEDLACIARARITYRVNGDVIFSASFAEAYHLTAFAAGLDGEPYNVLGGPFPSAFRSSSPAEVSLEITKGEQ